MGLTLRSTLEFAAPLLAVYVFVLGAPFPTALTSFPLSNSLSRRTTSTSSTNTPSPISNNTLDWATTALAYPPLLPDPSDKTSTSCAHHTYKTLIYSTTPLVLYMPSFLSTSETSHLLALAAPHYVPSTIHASPTSNASTHAPSVRHSEKALLPRTPLAGCIEDRALSLQGHAPDVFVERLYAQRYDKGGHYARHYDWARATRTGGRKSSFMVWLDDGCAGGGTQFPRLRRHASMEWCEFVDCEADEGTTFKPIAGNAVFWENLREDGSGYEESLHAGLPVEEGRKVGLNIWSWWQPGLGRALRERHQEQPP